MKKKFIKKTKRVELICDYWGDTYTPEHWMTIAQLAKKWEVTEEVIEGWFALYAIRQRTSREELVGAVWNLLSYDWNMEHEKDFKCGATVDHRVVDFYIFREGVAITVAEGVPTKLVTTEHKETMFCDITTNEEEYLLTTVVNVLKRCEVYKRQISVGGDNGGFGF